MPYSRQHNLVFVHIPKNAGTSVENALGIYSKDKNGKSIVSEDIVFGNAMQHYTIDEILKHLLVRGIDVDVSRSFAVIRDPVERFISHYKWTPDGEKSGRSLESFFFLKFLPTLGDTDVEARHRWPQHTYILSSNNVLVGYLLNFKKINNAFIKLTKALDLHAIPSLEHHKKSGCTTKSTDISDEIADFIKKFYRYDCMIIDNILCESDLVRTDDIPAEERDKLNKISAFSIRESAVETIRSNHDPEFRKKSLFALSCLELKGNHFISGLKYYMNFILTMPGLRIASIAILMSPLIALSRMHKQSHHYLLRKLIKLV